MLCKVNEATDKKLVKIEPICQKHEPTEMKSVEKHVFPKISNAAEKQLVKNETLCRANTCAARCCWLMWCKPYPRGHQQAQTRSPIT